MRRLFIKATVIGFTLSSDPMVELIVAASPDVGRPAERFIGFVPTPPSEGLKLIHGQERCFLEARMVGFRENSHVDRMQWYAATGSFNECVTR